MTYLFDSELTEQLVTQFGNRIMGLISMLKLEHLFWLTADGVIISANKTGKHYSKYIKVRHDDTFETFYAHLSRIIVEEGDNVKKGEIIGYVGQSGLAAKPNLSGNKWRTG